MVQKLTNTQLAAFDTNEVYSRRFQVLALARGFYEETFLQSRRHRFSGRAGNLFFRISPAEHDMDHLVVDRPPPRRKEGRPDLLCVFCQRLNPYDSLSELGVPSKQARRNRRFEAFERDCPHCSCVFGLDWMQCG